MIILLNFNLTRGSIEMRSVLIFNFIVFIFINELTAQNNEISYGQFSFSFDVKLPGTPESVYDLATGDISGWWDHSMSEKPYKLFIEAKPGGGFYELFDEKGNGVKHAEVIYADRGKLLRFDGPLGLSGKAIQIVTTYKFEKIGSDSTLINLTVNAAGQMEKDLDKVVKGVWHHFLVERFKPFVKNKLKNQ